MNDMQDEEDEDEDWEEPFADFEDERLGDVIIGGWRDGRDGDVGLGVGRRSGGWHGFVVLVV